MRLHANHVSIEESGGEFFQVWFDSEARGEDGLDLSEPDCPYFLVQRQFEDDDGVSATSKPMITIPTLAISGCG